MLLVLATMDLLMVSRTSEMIIVWRCNVISSLCSIVGVLNFSNIIIIFMSTTAHLQSNTLLHMQNVVLSTM